MNAVEIYRRQVGSRIKLTREDEVRYVREARDGDPEAWRVIVRAHGYSVMQVAEKFCGRGVDREDLIQAGNLGLVKAVQRFDPGNPKRTRFDTYARYWIMHHVGQEVRVVGNPIRRPSTWWSGREKLLAKCDAVQLAVLRGEFLRGDVSLGEARARDESDLEQRYADARDAIAGLEDPQLRDVLMARMQGESLRSIADRLGCSPEWVNQLSKKAVRVLRETMAPDPSYA